jgi:hypothetical protein
MPPDTFNSPTQAKRWAMARVSFLWAMTARTRSKSALSMGGGCLPFQRKSPV